MVGRPEGISHETIINSDKLLTVIPATTIYENHYSRILLLEIDNEIKAWVFSMYANKVNNGNYFSGELLITDLEGNFIDGYRIKNGFPVSQFIRSKTSTSKSAGEVCPEHGTCTADSTCVDCMLYLDETIIMGDPAVSDSEPVIWYIDEFQYGEGPGPDETEIYWDYSGGGGGGTTTTTEEEDRIFVELDGKELCAYQRLTYAGVNASNYHNLMTQLFVELGEGNLGNADLTITTEDLGFSGGKSQYLGDGKFKIIISNMSDRSSIEIAAVMLLHEMSHAFLAKHYLLYNKSFAELYSMYINDSGLENYSHDIMKDQFLGRMAQTLQDYDSTLFSNFEDYVTLASGGVYSNYSEEQLAEIKSIKNYALQKDSRCTTLER